MLYYSLGFLGIAVVMLGLGFTGIAPGAAGIANLFLLVALGLLGATAWNSRHHTIHHHHHHTRRFGHRH